MTPVISGSSGDDILDRATKAMKAKRDGVHYTPPELARFLADVTVSWLPNIQGDFRVLDPACGDGALLEAFADSLPEQYRTCCALFGYETDQNAAQLARRRLQSLDVAHATIEVCDFVDRQATRSASGEKAIQRCSIEPFDVLIANPPYVRTQVLGAAKAQSLAKSYDLTGRIDLYQVFMRAMTEALKPGGTLGLLTSNRFLTTRSGEAVRRLLREQFSLKQIYDLGDTRLFKAAVLPAILVAHRSETLPAKLDNSSRPCRFDRVYQFREPLPDTPPQVCGSVLDSLRQEDLRGLIRTDAGIFQLERGQLTATDDDAVWSLSTADFQRWLGQVNSRRHCTFHDVAQIRVGIKTTADEVFLRDDWADLPAHLQPEPSLLRPLIRHFDASRWAVPQFRQQVVYPHVDQSGKRGAIDFSRFPRAANYFRHFESRLRRRRYLVDSGREWYEIWVPQSPSGWTQPKIVYPDISAEPRFFLDRSGAIVNGDCYWITLRPGFDNDLLFLMLAVANSTLSSKYYDIAFHNKLYAGRRRYMTQYVKTFPLPAPDSRLSGEIIDRAKSLTQAASVTAEQERELDLLVWRAFGLEP